MSVHAALGFSTIARLLLLPRGPPPAPALHHCQVTTHLVTAPPADKAVPRVGGVRQGPAD